MLGRRADQHTSYAMADIFLVDRPHWATHRFKARAVLDSIWGDVCLKDDFTVKWYKVEVSDALSENCCNKAVVKTTRT